MKYVKLIFSILSVSFAAFFPRSGLANDSAFIGECQSFAVAFSDATAKCEAQWLENFNNIKQLLTLENYTGLELWVADVKGMLESSWGHAQLRFVGSGKAPYSDLVISFAANVEAKDMQFFNLPVYFKGMVGSYRVFPFVRKTRDFWDEYNKGEGRPIYRHIIPTNRELRRKLLLTLKNWIELTQTDVNRSPLKSYKFTSKNCVTVIMELLEESGFMLQGTLANTHMGITGILAPTDAPYFLRKELLNPFLPLVMSSYPAVLQKAADALDISLKDFLKGKNLPSDTDKILVSTLDRIALAQILTKNSLALGSFFEIIKNYVHAGGYIEPELLYGLVTLPRDLYELCTDLACGERVKSASRQAWVWVYNGIYDDEWRAAFRERLEAYQAYRELYRENFAAATERAHYIHWRTLIETLR